jgi:hypothetical protein
MLRRAISAVAATAVALLTLIVASGLSWAETAPPYPAPPVTGSVASSVVATTSQSIVASTSQSVVVQPTPAPVQPATDLASTGAGLNVGLTVGIGVAIILLGIVLVVFGARRSGRKHA